MNTYNKINKLLTLWNDLSQNKKKKTKWEIQKNKKKFNKVHLTYYQI